MIIKKIHTIDRSGYYQGDEILEIPETLVEARSIGYPIVIRQEPIDPEFVPEPEGLQLNRDRIRALNSFPSPGPEILQEKARINLEIDRFEREWEDLKRLSTFREIEEFNVMPLNDRQIETEIPSGLYKPMWDGFKWIEGMPIAEIEAINQSPIGWDAFVLQFIQSDLDETIAASSNQVWVTRLQIALDKRPNVEVEWSCLCWNKAVEGMPSPFSDDQVELARSIVAENRIPLHVNDDGTIEPIANATESTPA